MEILTEAEPSQMIIDEELTTSANEGSGSATLSSKARPGGGDTDTDEGGTGYDASDATNGTKARKVISLSFEDVHLR